MSKITLNGQVQNAPGSATTIMLSNVGTHIEKSYMGSFNDQIPLESGTHSLFVHGYVPAPGSLTINISGDVSAVSPGTPKVLQGHFYQAFIFTAT